MSCCVNETRRAFEDIITIFFNIVAALTGLAAAYFWYRASKVDVLPSWAKTGGIGFEPVTRSESQWICGLQEATRASGSLNKTAAFLTAVSILSSSVSSAISMLK